jgi:hypothetical protein
MLDERIDYLKSIWNIIDVISFIFYLIYCLVRLSYEIGDLLMVTEEPYIPGLNDLEDYTEKLILLKIVSICIMVMILLKTMFYMRVNENFGLLVQLIQQCLHDVK